MKKFLVVGAGFTGATIARELADAGHEIQVIDRRPHVAGNAYDYTDPLGIRVHKYGPHLFHTKNHKVYDYLGQFCEWVKYQHKVKALLSDGRFVTLPVNAETCALVGEHNIVDTFFRPYTKKMWGLDIEQLDPSILQRVPVRNDMNELYFPDDKYQALPRHGYTSLIENMLDDPKIKVNLQTDFDHTMMFGFDHTFNSMPIDVYYNYVYGPLPYRSIKFHHKVVPMNRVLPTATVNFTHSGPYTRVTEWRLLPEHGSNDMFTTLTFEEPCDYLDNNMERYYPVKDITGANREKYNKYKELADKEEKITFVGRCGQYVYIDMDMAVNSALRIAMDHK
jgi:UDP-galactopyranose mutase